MLINPSRETFLNFPSATMPDKTVTVFLPESAVPLHQRYPVVYLLGAIPKDAEAAQAVLDKSGRKAIFVGINFTDKDLANVSKLTLFFAQELIPYIDTNYSTLTDAPYRGVAALGGAGAKALQMLLARKDLFGRAVLVHGGEEALLWANMDPSMRILAAGTRAELAAWQTSWQQLNGEYGPDFVTKIDPDATLFSALNLDYLFAPAEEVTVVKVQGSTVPNKLSLSANEKAVLTLQATLANGQQFDVLGLDLRISPPYVSWDAATGELTPIAGAATGKVKLSVTVDNVDFTTKIKLKK